MREYKGSKYYLLGKRKEDGKKVWLEEASWDCGWYWGLGYIEIFNHKYTDTDEFTHFSALFFGKGIPASWNDYFEDSVLDEHDTYKILELMDTIYTCRNYSDTLHRGGSNITTIKDEQEVVKNNAEYDRINKDVIPTLMNKVYELLS